MDYGNMLSESFNYAKEGVIEKRNRWLMLAIATLILCIPLTGYIMQIYRGAKPAPEVDNWGKLFVDGIMLFIISIIYSIPLFILQFLVAGTFMASAMTGDINAAMAGVGIVFLIVYVIVAIIIGLILPFALIRFARNGTFGEAFNFNAILAQIGKIGWVNYIIALIIVAIVIGIPVAIIYFILLMLIFALSMIGLLIAAIVFLIIIPPIAVFEASYLTQIYDSVTA
jgi:Protein of unknown function (DUF4013)